MGILFGALGVAKLIPFKVWLAIALAILIAGWLIYFAKQQRLIGADAVRARIEQQNRETSDEAYKAEQRVRACAMAGRVWRNHACND